MRRLLFVAVIGLSGCLENEPPKPHPAMVALQSACEKGDTSACAEVLAVEQRSQALRQQAAANYAANYKPYELKVTPMQPTYIAPTAVIVQPTYGVSPLRRNAF